jgi:hypothetical protein
MMPVERLPAASWQTALGLGFLSSIFDNIPLTALALKQGGYGWGFLAYAVGFGGSMIWFGSSSSVAISNMYPEVKSVGQWLRHGWYISIAYVIGFFAMLWGLALASRPSATLITSRKSRARIAHRGRSGCRGSKMSGDFDLGSLRKHIERRDRIDREFALQFFQVPRQCRGIA